jgi:hypothetical protein
VILSTNSGVSLICLINKTHLKGLNRYIGGKIYEK